MPTFGKLIVVGFGMAAAIGIPAGIALAFSVLIKPLSVALAAYLIWRRDWRRGVRGWSH